VPRRASPFATVVLLMVVCLVGGVWLGGHPSELPGFVRDVFVSDHDTRVVNEAIDRVAHDYYRPVSRERLTSASISGMLASLHDPYSSYLAPKALHEFDRPASFTGIGVTVDPEPAGLRVARVFDSSPAQRSGLKAGDLIVAVGGRSLHGLSPTAATDLIRGRPGTDVLLTLQAPGRGTAEPGRAERGRGGAGTAGSGPVAPGTAGSRPAGGATRTVKVTRATISEPVVASTVRRVHGMKLGWVYLATFSEGASDQLRQAVVDLLHKGARGLVLDLRADGGGLVSEARLVASVFVRSGTIVTTRGRTQPTVVLRASGEAISASIPVVVLVDHDTASASEIVTAALQDHRRATVVGVHTYGKGVFQELEPLAAGGAIKITVGEYFTPNGRNLGGSGVSEGAGITPEVHVTKGVDGEHGLDVALSTLAAKVK
jgi:carboxyl-terminal processing protease